MPYLHRVALLFKFPVKRLLNFINFMSVDQQISVGVKLVCILAYSRPLCLTQKLFVDR